MRSGISINQAQLQGVRNMLSEIQNGATKAMVTSINKTLATTKTTIRKKLGEKLNLKAARIEEDLSVEKATYESVSGRVTAKGEPVGLVNFAGAQLKTGVKVKIYKDGSAKLLKHAFRKSKSGKEHLWWRQYSGPRKSVVATRRYARLPRGYKYKLNRLQGPRIEDVLAKPEILTPIEQDAANLLTQNLGRAVDDILRRHNL